MKRYVAAFLIGVIYSLPICFSLATAEMLNGMFSVIISCVFGGLVLFLGYLLSKIPIRRLAEITGRESNRLFLAELVGIVVGLLPIKFGAGKTLGGPAPVAGFVAGFIIMAGGYFTSRYLIRRWFPKNS